MSPRNKTTLLSIVLYLGTASVAVPVPQRRTRIIADNYQTLCGCIILTSLNTTANSVIAQELLQNISDSLDTSDQARCNSWNGDPGYEIENFADQFGKSTKHLNGSAGVFAPDIYAFCGPPELGQAFSFADFSASTAGLLLPWVAIFTQLPRQTGSSYEDLLSTFISLGTPAWTTSSILLAVLYRRSVSSRFSQLERKLNTGHNAIFAQLRLRCDAAKIILQAFVQAPVRINARPGVLSSLIASPENHGWWIAAAAEIKGLWRKIDAIFIAQSFIAALAWVLAIVADFWSLPGEASSSNSDEWQICMGTLWLWLFAATFGPAAIKSFCKAKTLHRVLSSPSEMPNLIHVALHDGNNLQQHGQTAIIQKSGLIARHISSHRQSSRIYEIRNEDDAANDNVQVPDVLGLSIVGDAETEGLNTFAYRFLSSGNLSSCIMGGFESLYDRLKHEQIPYDGDNEGVNFQAIEYDPVGPKTSDLENRISKAPVASTRNIRRWNSEETPEKNISGSSKAFDDYLAIKVTDITAYPEWNEVTSEQCAHLIVSNLFGLVVQWGTTGPAIYIMYYSPPVGLGCDSGGLLIYAVGATLSWLLLNSSSIFSHAALLHYQRWHAEFPSQAILEHYKRTTFYLILCGAAVISRVLGQVIAVISACWILVWSFLTYTNVMETPYCTTAYFSLRVHGWMRLWNYDPRQFTPTKVEELRCLVFGSFVAYFACVLIFSLTSDGKKQRHRQIVTAALSLGFPVLVLPLYAYGVRSIEKVS